MLKLRRKREDPNAELRRVLGDAELPTFPSVVLRTLQVLRDPDSSAVDVAAALAIDPGLTIRLLKLVNSAAFGPARPVTSVDQAVAVAGFGAIESMVLSVGVNHVLPNGNTEGFDHSRFWWTASRRASIARAFAAELHPASVSLCFTAGLLQDMAVPLLASARDDYRPLLQAWHDGAGELHDLEASQYDWAHGEVADWLCAEWELPVELTDAIAGHHDYDADKSPPGVQLAAPLREVEPPDARDLVVVRASEEFGLDPDRVVELLDQADDDAIEVARLLG